MYVSVSWLADPQGAPHSRLSHVTPASVSRGGDGGAGGEAEQLAVQQLRTALKALEKTNRNMQGFVQLFHLNQGLKSELRNITVDS